MIIETHLVGEHGCQRCGCPIPDIVNADGKRQPLFVDDKVGIIEHAPFLAYLVGEHDSNQECKAKSPHSSRRRTATCTSLSSPT